jgi:hypothetical protein
MRLITDYSQYYDGVFDGEGPDFHRRAFGRGGLSKRAQFELFDQLGLATPPHGTVTRLAAALPGPAIWGSPLEAWWGEEIELVVYEDEFAHGGAGKRRVPLRQARLEWPNHFASLYVPPARGAVNFRHARIGRIGVWLRQEGGPGEWRSNRRDAERVLARAWHPEPPPVLRAMWAIDFIPAATGLLAIDFNTAPDLDTLGETARVAPEEILAELAHAAAREPESLGQME